MVPSALKLVENRPYSCPSVTASMVDYSPKRRHQAYNVHHVKQQVTMIQERSFMVGTQIQTNQLCHLVHPITPRLQLPAVDEFAALRVDLSLNPWRCSSLRLKVYRLQHTDSVVGWQLLIDNLDSLVKQPPCCGSICSMRTSRRLRCIWVDVGDIGENEWKPRVVGSIVQLAPFACIHTS